MTAQYIGVKVVTVRTLTQYLVVIRLEDMSVIVLAGTIGAGKSSLTALLANHLGSQAYYESVDDNEVLPLFYADPNKYAFLLQIYFLNKRFDSIKKAMQEDNNVLDQIGRASCRERV